MPTWKTRTGADRPFPIFLGHEFSGVPTALGAGVTDWAEGDPVCGLNDWFADGAQAEDGVAPAAPSAPKPRALDHVQAAVVPIFALTAWEDSNGRCPMKHNCSRVPAVQAGDNESRVKIADAASCSSFLWKAWLVFFISSSSLSIGCSVLQSFVESLVTGEAPPDETYAGRQHFPVTPEEAIACLIHVAPQQGWEVVSSGYEYGMHGAPGTFFRLTPSKSLGDKPTLSGVFYAEPSGSYVRVSETNGLPELLVEPLIAEIKRKVAER